MLGKVVVDVDFAVLREAAKLIIGRPGARAAPLSLKGSLRHPFYHKLF